MTTFVKFDKNGTILATCRLDFIGRDHPYADLAENESVIEAQPSDTFATMSCIDIHNNYKVSLPKKKLIRK